VSSRRKAAKNPIRAAIAEILRGYRAVKGEVFSDQNPIRIALSELAEQLQQAEVVRAHATVRVTGSTGSGKWADVPWIGLRDDRSEDSVTLLFCADMRGVYLTVLQRVKTEGKKRIPKPVLERLARRSAELRPAFADLEAHGFLLDDTIALSSTTAQGQAYEPATIAHKHYAVASLPDDAALLADIDAALTVYDRHVAAQPAPTPIDAAAPAPRADFERRAALAELTAAIEAKGFVFEPWQIAAYVTALRTKPFVILAGVSGTGKSQLPRLVAELTGGVSDLLPVRPDWTDSSDVLGYTDLAGRFRPGPLLALAAEAAKQPSIHHVCVVDEMNLARVEQYFAEVLSRIEDRREVPGGGLRSGPLLTARPPGEEVDSRWAGVALPENLALVGTVNMDETTHGFSRKVLDRAFSLEISDIDLARWKPAAAAPPAVRPWPAAALRPRAIRLGGLSLRGEEEKLVTKAVGALVAVNEVLRRAELQVGYRVRDEIALFLLHAHEVKDAFVTRADKGKKGEDVDPLDLALVMKILPRIAGGSGAVRDVVTGLFGWAIQGKPFAGEDDATRALDAWREAGRPGRVAAARFPRMAARLALMADRLLSDGYTSFWA